MRCHLSHFNIAFQHPPNGKKEIEMFAKLKLKLRDRITPKVKRALHDFGEPRFSYLEVEAALCVWECIDNWTLLDKQNTHHAWCLLREKHGSIVLRNQSVEIGQWCLSVYDLCTKNDPNFFDDMSYDWDVIPLILSRCVNFEGVPVISSKEFPDAHNVAQTIMKERIEQKEA